MNHNKNYSIILTTSLMSSIRLCWSAPTPLMSYTLVQWRLHGHDEETGVLYFSTSVDTGKVEEIEQHPHVNINMQSSSQFVSLSGEAIVSNDRDLIADMYNASWKAWYPDGPEQKDIRLIKFNPEQAEYWNLAGLKGLKFLWEAGKAIAQDEQVDFDDPATHSKVDM